MSVTANDRVDSEIAAALASFPANAAKLTLEALPTLREMTAAMWKSVALPDGVSIEDHAVDDHVRVRVYRPGSGTGIRPCIYWIHGGGFVVGTYDMNDQLLAQWCLQFDCAAVSVEYRLAPEHPYPLPLDDCVAGLSWTHEHAGVLGVDPRRVGVAGASAGGGLAAALALRARNESRHPLAFELLVYPMLDHRQQTESSGWDAPILSAEANAVGWAAYLGDLDRGAVPAYASPTLADDVAGLPQTFLMVGGVDVLLDECVDYALRLTRSGVPTELHVYPGAPHLFDMLAPDTALARRATADLEEWLAIVLGRGR